jgi:hypothetical protein
VTSVPDARGLVNGTPVNLAANQVVAGKLGQGIRFTGNDGRVTFTNPLTGAGPHTISAWVAQESTLDNDAIIVLGNSACNGSRFLYGRFNSTNVGIGFYCDDWDSTNQNIVGDGLRLVHWVFDAGQNWIYLDGVLASGPHGDGASANTTGTTGILGYAPLAWGINMGLKGTLDEVRIATVPRTAGWIATEFANQSSPSTFYAVSPAP